MADPGEQRDALTEEDASKGRRDPSRLVGHATAE